jgi:hypothetical protein
VTGCSLFTTSVPSRFFRVAVTRVHSFIRRGLRLRRTAGPKEKSQDKRMIIKIKSSFVFDLVLRNIDTFKVYMASIQFNWWRKTSGAPM